MDENPYKAPIQIPASEQPSDNPPPEKPATRGELTLIEANAFVAFLLLISLLVIGVVVERRLRLPALF